MSNQPLFYRSKPMFGIDVGHNSVKVVQTAYNKRKKTLETVGYGFNTFNENAIKDGQIVQHEPIAKAAYSLLTELMVGGVTTDRIATSIPVSHTFTRMLHLPKLEKSELEEAVRTEAEQYVPLPPEEMYLDFEVNRTGNTRGNEQYEVLMVAAPRTIVDSYMKLFEMLNLEVGLVETSLISSVRGAQYTQVLNTEKLEDTSRNKEEGADGENRGATLLLDLGSASTDLSIFDDSIRVTGTVEGGGENMTTAISKELKVPRRQAFTYKTRYGIGPGKKQKELLQAVEPTLSKLIKEIKKMQRYYKSRSVTQSDITNIIMLGGGANLPGLTDYFKEKTGLSVSICNPWKNISFEELQPPHQLETTTYTTAVGLSLAGLERSHD